MAEKRVIRYGDKKIEMPEGMTLEQAKAQMARFFAELAEPEVTTKKEGDTTVYVFSKKAGKKGGVETVGMINAYDCEVCGLRIITVNHDAGTTPYLVGCKADGCRGLMVSQFYRVSQTLAATHEWYRPDEAERASLTDDMREHVEMGGLLLRPVVGVVVGKNRPGSRHG